jgi:DNA invertase Pin-like site-specific DNA recombinase
MAGEYIIAIRVRLKYSIDTHTTAGRFFFYVMASLSEMERELIVERHHDTGHQQRRGKELPCNGIVPHFIGQGL